MTFEEFKQKLPKKAPERFTARYYGTRALNIFPKEFLDYVDECPQFIDITAGGGRFTYAQALKGKTVGANDRCFYSYCALVSVLTHMHRFPDWLKVMWEQTRPELWIEGYNGYFNNMRDTYVSDDVRSYVDSICASYQNDPFLLYCVGKAIRSMFTYRGLAWCSVTPSGGLSNLVTLKQIHHFVMKTAWTTNLYSERVKSSYNQVFNSDALKAVQEFREDLIKGALVYIDPAWPWATGKSNPYRWVSEDLSSILMQQEIKVPFWASDSEQIFIELNQWITHSLIRGAKYAAVCAQDTNYPPLGEVRTYLEDNFKLVKWIEVEDTSKAAHRKYKTVWGIISS